MNTRMIAVAGMLLCALTAAPVAADSRVYVNAAFGPVAMYPDDGPGAFRHRPPPRYSEWDHWRPAPPRHWRGYRHYPPPPPYWHEYRRPHHHRHPHWRDDRW